MLYEIHLYVPKTGQLTPSMIEWLYQHGRSTDQPEQFWPVRKLNQRAMARVLVNLDPTLYAQPGDGDDIELIYPNQQIDLRLYVHQRGVILSFPYMGSLLARIVLGISYTYIRFLYEAAGFWSYDPQLNVLSYADDYQSIDETAALMDTVLPKLLNS
ncbi:MAG: hypothetical protein GYB67_10440 [Chloroflexi bacterium]|nr:hypothetical protein [Chloroflexota bacterium]